MRIEVVLHGPSTSVPLPHALLHTQSAQDLQFWEAGVPSCTFTSFFPAALTAKVVIHFSFCAIKRRQQTLNTAKSKTFPVSSCPASVWEHPVLGGAGIPDLWLGSDLSQHAALLSPSSPGISPTRDCICFLQESEAVPGLV